MKNLILLSIAVLALVGCSKEESDNFKLCDECPEFRIGNSADDINAHLVGVYVRNDAWGHYRHEFTEDFKFSTYEISDIFGDIPIIEDAPYKIRKATWMTFAHNSVKMDGYAIVADDFTLIITLKEDGFIVWADDPFKKLDIPFPEGMEMIREQDQEEVIITSP